MLKCKKYVYKGRTISPVFCQQSRHNFVQEKCKGLGDILQKISASGDNRYEGGHWVCGLNEKKLKKGVIGCKLGIKMGVYWQAFDIHRHMGVPPPGRSTIFFFLSFHFYYPVLGTGGGKKTYRDNHQSLPQPTIDTYL